MAGKGLGCSINGKKYELQVYNILKNSKLNENNFNTQNENELGVCSSKNDDITKKWIGSTKNKIPNASKNVFEDLISTITLFNGNIPPFMLKDITHEEWMKIKKETTDYNDIYIDCPDDTIMKLYSEKGCSYIQISEKVYII